MYFKHIAFGSVYLTCVLLLIGQLSHGCEYEVKHSKSYNPLLQLHSARDPVNNKYAVFPESLRLEMLEETKKMFTFAYDSYMKHAFPQDELNPVFCSGRGPDYFNPSNININDILGNYSLTLIDTLDTLAVMRNLTEFKRAVQLVIDNVSFDVDSVVQVFEVNIRLLGGLLSAHLLITDPRQPFGDLKPDGYEGELLEMAHDLATRLLPAFENTKTGIPFPRVHLQRGVPGNTVTDTCTAGAGSLLVEFGLLSRLVGDPIYESYARRANKAIWDMRSKATGLLGNTLDIQSGKWTGRMSGLGAGLDSFFEYLLKSYIMFGNTEDFLMFNTSYHLIKSYMRKGRAGCNYGEGEHPLYVNVDMNNGVIHTTWIDSLQAAFAGVQVLSGDIEEAICSHALYLTIWRLFGALPERFNWQLKKPDVLFYPLRPEFVESTYLLYQATRNPFYLHVGREILQDLNQNAKAKCGYATIHSVLDMSHEDRMESFFLSETCKYLYLLFDIDNPLNTLADRYLFTTEGHVLPVNYIFPSASWQENLTIFPASEYELEDSYLESSSTPLSVLDERSAHNSSDWTCDAINDERTYSLPLKSRYLAQLSKMLGVENY